MPYSERLRPDHALSLNLEGLGLPTHVGALAIFEAKPLLDAAGVFAIDRIQNTIQWALDAVPHARQIAQPLRFETQWVWVDDERFNTQYHVRHSRLPRPGNERQLKQLCAQLLSERLDPKKPLWEVHVIEGLEDDRFAVLLKIHPSVLDGAAIPELLAQISALDPHQSLPAVPTWRARPAPPPAQQLADAAVQWAEEARKAFSRTREVVGNPLGTVRAAARGAAALREVLRHVSRETEVSPLDPKKLGGLRRVDLLQVPRREIERIAARLQCPGEDVSLSMLAGGLGRFLHTRGDSLSATSLRALVQLPNRSDGESPRAVGLRVALPVTEPDPIRMAVEVSHACTEAQAGPLLEGLELVERFESALPARVQTTAAARGASLRGTSHLAVHFIEGPRQPFALLGARAIQACVFAPLFPDQGLSVTITSSGPWLSFGFNADADLLPDLPQLADAVGFWFGKLGAIGADTARTSEASNERRPS